MLSNTVRLLTGLNMQIALTDERDPYYLGDTISGKVVIGNIDPALKCFYVRIRIFANVIVRVDNLKETLSDTVFNKVFPAIDEEDGEVMLWEAENNPADPQSLFFPSGVHEFPFVFDTSKFRNCPPSHECGKGAVRWFLEAQFHRPLNFDITTKHDLRVTTVVPLSNPAFDHPITKNCQMPITGLFGMKPRGSMEASLQVHRQSFLPGQPAHVTATFANQCDDDITVSSMNIKIVQSSKCTEGRSRSAIYSTVILNQECLRVPMSTKKRGKHPMNVDVIIPSVVPCFENPYITVTYSMDLTVQTSKGKIDLSCPIFIGSLSRPANPQAAGSAAPAQPQSAAPGQNPPAAGAPAPAPAGVPPQ